MCNKLSCIEKKKRGPAHSKISKKGDESSIDFVLLYDGGLLTTTKRSGYPFHILENLINYACYVKISSNVLLTFLSSTESVKSSTASQASQIIDTIDTEQLSILLGGVILQCSRSKPLMNPP